MSTIENDVVEYPESDGKPMGETDWHIYWTLQLRQLLQAHYKDQRVYVGSDMFIYYEEGNPKKSVAPDCFVVFDCDPKFRRVFKVWEEKRVPGVIFEITSRSSLDHDLNEKPKLYASWGVQEYYIFDPEAECISPALRGFQLSERSVIEMEGPLFVSSQLRCQIHLREGQLELLDLVTGEQWQTREQLLETENAKLRREIEQLRKGRPTEN